MMAGPASLPMKLSAKEHDAGMFSSFCIFAEDLSTSDEDASEAEQHEEILYFFPAAVPVEGMCRHVQFCKGLLSVTEWFGVDTAKRHSEVDHAKVSQSVLQGRRTAVVRLTERRYVMVEVEPGVWAALCLKSPKVQYARPRTSLLPAHLVSPLSPHAVCTPVQPAPVPSGGDVPTPLHTLPLHTLPDDDTLVHYVLGLHDTYRLLHGGVNRVLAHPAAAAVATHIRHLRALFRKTCRQVDKEAYAVKYAASRAGASAAPPPTAKLQAGQREAMGQAAELLQLQAVSPIVALRHTLAAVYDFGIWHTDFASLNLLHAIERQGVLGGLLFGGTLRRLKEAVRRARASCAAVDHTSVLFDGRVVAGAAVPGLAPLMRYLRWHTAAMCQGTYVPPWRWHHAGPPPTPGMQSGGERSGDAVGVAVGMRPRGWSSVEPVLGAGAASDPRLPAAATPSEDADGAGSAEDAAMARAAGLLRGAAVLGLRRVPGTVAFWWSARLPAEALAEQPKEVGAAGGQWRLPPPPKAREEAAGITHAFLYAHKPAPACPPAFTAAAGAGGVLQGLAAVPPRLHVMRVPPIALSYLDSLPHAAATATVFAEAVSGVPHTAAPPTPEPGCHVSSLLRGGGAGPGMVWFNDPAGQQPASISRAPAPPPSAHPPSTIHSTADAAGTATAHTQPRDSPASASSSDGSHTGPEAPVSPSMTRRGTLTRSGPRAAVGRRDILRRYGGRPSRELQAQASASSIAAAEAEGAEGDEGGVDARVPRLWCPGVFLEGPEAPSHRVVAVQAGNATALLYIRLQPLVSGSAFPAFKQDFTRPTDPHAEEEEDDEDDGEGVSPSRVRGLSLGPTARRAGSMALRAKASDALVPQQSSAPAPLAPAQAGEHCASAALRRLDGELSEAQDTCERDTVAWRAFRWAVLQTVRGELLPALREAHPALAQACAAAPTSMPTHIYYPGTDRPGSTGGRNALVHMAGLGPPPTASQASTHGGVVASQLLEQLPKALRVPLHAAHTALQTPPHTALFPHLAVPAHKAEYVEATRDFGMVVGRHGEGQGTALLLFRGAPPATAAAAQAEALLSSTLGGLYM